MTGWLLPFFCCFAWIISGYGDPTGNLDDEQVDLVKYSSPVNLSTQNPQKILSSGLLESAIAKLHQIYPHLNITDLDRTNNESVFLKNQYDTVVIYLALEKDPDRVQNLRMIYEALKLGGKGIIVLGPKSFRSIHYWVEQFVESNTKWKPFISNTLNLSLEDYRILIQNIGFSIVDEKNWASTLLNTDTSRWLCDRWIVPLSMEFGFTNAFYRYLSGIFKHQVCFFTEMCYFIVEK